jgi:glucose-fructose oxidoreductase
MKNMRGHTDSKGRARRAKIDPVGFAVIGQGYFSQAAVLPAFAAARECELRALFSEDATKLKALGRKYHVPNALGYEQYDDFLRSGQVDAV